MATTDECKNLLQSILNAINSLTEEQKKAVFELKKLNQTIGGN